MGMDVFGTEPTSEEGEYFRRTIWGWHPLAELVCAFAPDIAFRCTHWHTNDGDGLNGEDSRNLAKALRSALDIGHVARYIANRDKALAAIPNQACRICNGTGIRRDKLGRRDGDPDKVIGTDTTASPAHPRFGLTGWCNGCDCRGWNSPFDRNYTVTADDVAEFAAFLAACGGFEIH